MRSDRHSSRRFKIEGSGQMLDALAKAIERALQTARATPDRTGTGTASRNSVTIEVEATNYDEDRLRYVIDSIDDAITTVSGWAESTIDTNRLFRYVIFPNRSVQRDDEKRFLFGSNFRISEFDV